MKRLKVCSIITAALVSASITAPISNSTAFAKENNTNVQMLSSDKIAATESSKVTIDVTNSNNATSTNALNPKFKITNTSGEAINLSDLKLKYYYNSDGSEKQNFWCDYSGTTSGTYKNFTGNVVGSINPYTTADGGNTNTYLQIAFNSAAGTLEAGQTMEVQTRIAKENWTNYDQSNDYSFNANGTSPWNKVTAELGSELIWGQGPVPIKDSVINPKNVEVDKAAIKDATINVDYQGNTLSAIKNGDYTLAKGKDYTEADGKVVLSQSYLSTLSLGDYTLAFDFNQGADSNLALTVINSNAQDSVLTPSSIDVNKLALKDATVDVQYKGNTLKTIKNGDSVLTLNKDYKIVDGKVVLTKSYLGSLPVGQASLVFHFDGGKDQTLTVNVVEDSLSVEIGKVSGKPGETVVVPVKVTGIKADKGLYAYNFKLGYDTTKFEDVKVTPAEGCPEPDSTFSGSVDVENGVIKARFTNSTLNDDPSQTIFSDGVLVNISFKIKAGSEPGVSPLTVTDEGEYYGVPKEVGDTVDFNPYKVNYVTGSIEIEDNYASSIITPDKTEVSKQSPDQINVSVDYKDNKLVAIKNGDAVLKEGKDYTIVDGKVVISRDYLKTLPVGQTALVFDFNHGKDQTLTINVVEDSLNVDIAKVSGKPGDTVVVPVKATGVKKDKGLYAYNFKLGYDTTKFEAVTVTPAEGCPNPDSTFSSDVDTTNGVIKARFTNSTLNDDPSETIFSDGVLVNISFKIKAGAEPGVSPITVKDAGEYYGVPKDLGGDIDFNAYKVGYTTGSIEIQDNYPSSVITADKTEVSKQSPDSINVSVDYKDNKLVAIKNGDVTLKEGKDYTITDGKVVISREYLKTLPVGQTALVFEFNHGGNQTLNINVVEDSLGVDIAKVSGKPGDTVVVPVSVKGIKKDKGLYAYSFKLGYDTTKFEAVTVAPAEGCPNPDSTFSSDVDTTNGIIKARFTNSTLNDDPSETIFSDGVLINVSFKIKANAQAGVSAITVKDAGEYYGVPKAIADDVDFNPYVTSYTEGTVTIENGTDEQKDSTITPNSAGFDKTTPSDVDVDVQYNGNTLDAIKNGDTALTKGKDYTESNGKVVLSKDYLNTLPEGDNTLVFDFNNGKDQSLTIKVSKTVVAVDSKLDKDSASFDANSPADVSVGVQYNGNTLNGIKDSNNYSLVKGTDYTEKDNTIVLSQSYLSKLAAGSVTLTFDFSAGKDQTLTVNVTAKKSQQLTIATDSIDVVAGQTFEVPILLKGVPADGILVGSVNIDYDSKVLECVGVKNGALITNPSSDFFAENTTDLSLVSMNFMQSSKAGARSIKTDGTFATVTFKVKANAAKGTTTLKEDPTLKINMYKTLKDSIPFEVKLGTINVK
ncbi:cohesin domain-containing protein [Clostridium sp. SHJSY1]|uniref:X2-like carbohydrate binding domain-containing protein n=1 Tax=Clostridium sp. SHJSY1 TaxID=2942483 RepID=UPI002874F648|nr:X2-like carbohydrate binding domain-containing protein [Clostridium sp. SHJSY1]MDS0526350.1 cohesin domain-containing protein [Clostridium sp. SHJSY1]